MKKRLLGFEVPDTKITITTNNGQKRPLCGEGGRHYGCTYDCRAGAYNMNAIYVILVEAISSNPLKVFKNSLNSSLEAIWKALFNKLS